MNFLRYLCACFDWMSAPRFTRYRPALRIGARRVEARLLRRLAWNTAETAR